MFGGDGKWEKRLERPWTNWNHGFYLTTISSPDFLIWVVSHWLGTAGLLDWNYRNETAPRCIAVICYVHDEFNDVQTTSSTGTTPDERRQQYGRNFASKIYPNGYHNCRGKDGKKCRIKQWWCLLPSKQGKANTKPLLCFGSWSERTMRTTRSKAQNTGMTWNDKQ